MENPKMSSFIGSGIIVRFENTISIDTPAEIVESYANGEEIQTLSLIDEKLRWHTVDNLQKVDASTLCEISSNKLTEPVMVDCEELRVPVYNRFNNRIDIYAGKENFSEKAQIKKYLLCGFCHPELNLAEIDEHDKYGTFVGMFIKYGNTKDKNLVFPNESLADLFIEILNQLYGDDIVNVLKKKINDKYAVNILESNDSSSDSEFDKIMKTFIRREYRDPYPKHRKIIPVDCIKYPFLLQDILGGYISTGSEIYKKTLNGIDQYFLKLEFNTPELAKGIKNLLRLKLGIASIIKSEQIKTGNRIYNKYELSMRLTTEVYQILKDAEWKCQYEFPPEFDYEKMVFEMKHFKYNDIFGLNLGNGIRISETNRIGMTVGFEYPVMTASGLIL